MIRKADTKKVQKSELSVNLKQEVDNLIQDLMKYAQIDENNIVKEYSELPSHFAYWLTKLSQFKNQLEIAKTNLETLEASLYVSFRKEKTSEKLTETLIHNLIILNKDWQEANQEVLELDYVVSILSNFVRVLEKKSEMLISLGATKRKEYDTYR